MPQSTFFVESTAVNPIKSSSAHRIPQLRLTGQEQGAGSPAATFDAAERQTNRIRFDSKFSLKITFRTAIFVQTHKAFRELTNHKAICAALTAPELSICTAPQPAMYQGTLIPRQRLCSQGSPSLGLGPKVQEKVLPSL